MADDPQRPPATASTTTLQPSSIDAPPATAPSQPLETPVTVPNTGAGGGLSVPASANVTATTTDMTAPSTAVPPATATAQAPNLAGLNAKERMMAQRRIIAEDPEWNLAPVEKLSEMCVQVIVKNFEKTPLLHGLPAAYRPRILSSISVTLPLRIAAPLIPDEIYWKRRALATHKLCDPSMHGGSWKRLFFELHVRKLIEDFVPKKAPLNENALNGVGGDGEVVVRAGVEEDKRWKDLVGELMIARDFVETLDVETLRPAVERDDGADNEKAGSAGSSRTAGVGGLLGARERGKEKETMKELVTNPTHPPPDHLDVGVLFTCLPKLSEFKVYYGVRDCGINYNRAYFGMTLPDCVNLCNALRSTSLLTSLTIHASGIDDDRCRLIASALVGNTSLRKLDLSHNKISHPGTRGLAKLLSIPHPSLTTLILTNNLLDSSSATTLGHALTHNLTLTHLHLAMNPLTDTGASSLLTHLARNNSVRWIDLSGTGMGESSVKALAALLKRNGEKLVGLACCCNKLGKGDGKEKKGDGMGDGTGVGLGLKDGRREDGEDITGKVLFDAVSQNKYVTTFDLRMTDLSAEYMVAIQGIINENTSAQYGM